MADVIVDNLLLELKIRMTALERGLAAAEDRIDQFTSRSKNAAKQQAAAVKASSQEQSMAYAATGAAAAAAFAVIVSSIKSGVNAANQYTSALTGLRSVAEGTGQDFGKILAATNNLTADGLIPVSEAATAFKNLLARGFEADQAVNMLNRLKDSAAFGRQASLSMGEAVRSATEGLKNENSILVDNAGVTKNVSVMWKEYAQQIGKGVESLTLAEKRQAEYNGIMQETRFQVGDAAKYAATFAGTQAEMGAATLKTQQAFGSAVQGGLQPFMQALTPVIRGIGEYTNQNPSFVAAITAGGTAMLGLAAIIGTVSTAINILKTAFAGMGAALGWAGLVAGVITVLVGFASAANEAEQAAAKYSQTLRDSVAAAQQEEAAIRNYQALVKSGSATSAELAAARQRVADLAPELITGYDAEGRAIVANNALLDAHIAKLDETIAKEKELILLRADETISTAQENIQALDAERKKQRQIYEDQNANYKRLEAELAENQQKYDAAVASGIGVDIDVALARLHQSQSLLKIVGGYVENASSEMRRIDGEITKNQSDIAQTRILQYEQEAQSLGELTAAQQSLVDQEMQRSLQAGDDAETFRAHAEAAITNLSRVDVEQRKLNLSTAATVDAVKQWADQEKNLENIRKANTAVAEARKIKAYADEVIKGKKGTKEYSDAVKALAKQFGTNEEAIEANIDGYNALAGQSLTSATNAQELLRQSLRQAIADLRATGAAGLAAAADLQALLAVFDQLGADTTTSSGGGGGARKKAWEAELEMIERVADAEDEYAQQYLEHLNILLQNDALSSKERQRLEKEREYAVLAVNGDLEQAHIEYLERLLQRERLSADERLDIEQRLFQAKTALMDQYQDFADAIMSAYTAKLEAQRDAQLSAIQAQISAAQERANKEIDAIRDTMDARIDAINAEIRALDDLSKAQDRTDKDAEDADKLRRLQAQLQYEKDGRNKQKLLEQIAALEASTTKRHTQEQLEDQKQALRDRQEAIRDEADKQIEIIQNQADREQAALNRRLAAAQKYWNNRLQMENVKQEALQFLNDASQQEIIALLESYAPEYLAKGQLLGSQFYGGLKPKIDAILAEIAKLRKEAQKEIVITVRRHTIYTSETRGESGTKSRTGAASMSGILAGIRSFAAAPDVATVRMIGSVQQAMDNMAYRSIRPAAMAAQAAIGASAGRSTAQAQSIHVKQTVVMQQPVPSPAQNARALRRESERLAKMLTR